MRNGILLPLLLALLGGWVLAACNNASGDKESSGKGQDAGTASHDQLEGDLAFEITGELKNPGADSVYIWDMLGNERRLVASDKLELIEDGDKAQFKLAGKLPSEGIYLFGGNGKGRRSSSMALIYIGKRRKFRLTGDMNKLLKTMQFEGAPQSQAFAQFQQEQYQFQKHIGQAQKHYGRMKRAKKEDKASFYKGRIDSMLQAQYADHKKLAQQDGPIATIAQIYQYKPYAEADQSKYPTEKAYFIEQYLNGIDWSDPKMGYYPPVYSKLFNYVNNLVNSYRVDYETATGQLDPILEQIPEDTKLKKVALRAIMNGTTAGQQQQRRRRPQNPYYVDIYLKYAEQYAEAFPDDDMTASLKKDLQNFSDIRIGKKAPNIVQQSPEGKQYKLSELRGNYVLVDFWASWCGPCRRNNPHLVKLYEQYKDDGFRVFSVSLDQKKADWKKAIEKDGLKWKYHVSDLNGNQNHAARKYGVSSIPYTVLLDPEGRIIAKGLRGPELEQKLEEIFNQAG